MAAGATVSAGSPIPIVATRASDGDWETTLPSFSPSFGAGYRPMLAIDGNGATTTLVTMTAWRTSPHCASARAATAGPRARSTATSQAHHAGRRRCSWQRNDRVAGYGPQHREPRAQGRHLRWHRSDPERRLDSVDREGRCARGVLAERQGCGLRHGATTWSFGDGSTATGTTASHTFRAPGAYTVKATSVDALGNESVTTREVVVDGPPARATAMEPRSP